MSGLTTKSPKILQYCKLNWGKSYWGGVSDGGVKTSFEIQGGVKKVKGGVCGK